MAESLCPGCGKPAVNNPLERVSTITMDYSGRVWHKVCAQKTLAQFRELEAQRAEVETQVAKLKVALIVAHGAIDRCIYDGGLSWALEHQTDIATDVKYARRLRDEALSSSAGCDLLERLKKLEAEVNEHRERANDYQTRWEAHRAQDCAIQCSRELAEILGTSDPVEAARKVRELQAQAAAIREMLQLVSDYLHNYPNDEGDIEFDRMCRQCREALSSSAGRDLLERLRKLKAVAEAARRLLDKLPPPPMPVTDLGNAALELEEALAGLEGGE